MYKILFVCTGNICRSPTAEGIMNKLIIEEGMVEEIYVDSAGTSGWHQGDAPDLRSIECADCYGVNLRELRSRPVLSDDFAEFDLILAMDESNIRDLDMKRPLDKRYQKAQVRKILEYAPQFGTDVPDPYYHNGFDRVYQMMDAACRNLLSEIKAKSYQS